VLRLAKTEVVSQWDFHWRLRLASGPKLSGRTPWRDAARRAL